MRERTEKLGGRYCVWSEGNVGTEVNLCIPVTGNTRSRTRTQTTWKPLPVAAVVRDELPDHLRRPP
jgi:hypothetical protein